MDSKKLIVWILLGGIIACVCLVVCDLLLPSSYETITVNPFKVDWEGISLRNMDLNAVYQTMLSAIIGFLMTIVFVEILIRKAKDDETERLKKVQLDNISKVLKYPIMHYHKAAICITNELMGGDFKEVKTNNLYVLDEIYEHTLFFDEQSRQTRIEFFTKCYSELHHSIANVVLNTDLSYNQDLSSLLTDFLYKSSEMNPCPIFLSWMKLKGVKDSFGEDNKSIEEEIRQECKNAYELKLATVIVKMKLIGSKMPYFARKIKIINPKMHPPIAI